MNGTLYTLAQLRPVVEMQRARVVALTTERLTGPWTQPYDAALDALNEQEYREGMILAVLEEAVQNLEEQEELPT